jgi:hypothetical protein
MDVWSCSSRMRPDRAIYLEDLIKELGIRFHGPTTQWPRRSTKRKRRTSMLCQRRIKIVSAGRSKNAPRKGAGAQVSAS